MACLAGLLLVFRPMDGARALLVLLGIAMLAEGILNLCVACSMIKIIRHQQPDVLDAEFARKEVKPCDFPKRSCAAASRS